MIPHARTCESRLTARGRDTDTGLERIVRALFPPNAPLARAPSVVDVALDAAVIFSNRSRGARVERPRRARATREDAVETTNARVNRRSAYRARWIVRTRDGDDECGARARGVSSRGVDASFRVCKQ
jgi:hypothetical protein